MKAAIFKSSGSACNSAKKNGSCLIIVSGVYTPVSPDTEKDLALDFRFRPPESDKDGRTGRSPERPKSREGVVGLPPEVLGLPMSMDERTAVKSILFMPDNDLLRLEKPKSGKASKDSRRSRGLVLVSAAIPPAEAGRLVDKAEPADTTAESSRTGRAWPAGAEMNGNGEDLPSLELFCLACILGDLRDPASVLA